MRKLIVGLMVGGLLAMAAPAIAQVADPLTLAASGVLMPFFGGSGNISLLEVASPVCGNPGLHMFFFDTACNRVGDSVGLPETTNDVAILNTSLVVPGVSGLIAIAQADPSGFELRPLDNPIHSRVYWLNAVTGRNRVLEPITLDTAGFAGAVTWNPLRTAATFFAPLEGGAVTTTVYFICPRSTIQTQGFLLTFVPPFGVFGGFPPIVPPFPALGATETLRARIYNTDEVFLRDVTTPCDCLVTKNVLTISNVYNNAVEAPDGTYTEIESDPGPVPPGSLDFAFTGYKSIQALGTPIDLFGRLSNGNRAVIQGAPLPANPR